MSDVRWALLRPDEDGNPLKWLGGEHELRELLADPEAWSIDEFVHIDEMQMKDPAYWGTGQAMLMRVEVVVPVRGGWRLPENVSITSEPTDHTTHTPVDDWTCSCSWKVDGFTAPELARAKLFDKHILPETSSTRGGAV